MDLGIFKLYGDDVQQQIVKGAIDRTDFPWDLLKPKLFQDAGRDHIPVEWADLSRYLGDDAEAGLEAPHDHSHGHSEIGTSADSHEFDLILFRERVLGLAWYSGKVSIESSLVTDPQLAEEVFICEAAHMVDFFYVSPDQRQAIFLAYHGGETGEHGHGWFEETGNQDYWAWVGESFMLGFAAAFADLDVTDDAFEHQTTEVVADAIRAILLPDQYGQHPYFGDRDSGVFHDQHKGVERDLEWPSFLTAVQSGRRPCGVCKPKALGD